MDNSALRRAKAARSHPGRPHAREKGEEEFFAIYPM